MRCANVARLPARRGTELPDILITVQRGRTVVSGVDSLRLTDLLYEAPEPPPSPTFGGIRTNAANLLYLSEKLPTAIWHDPENRLVEARTYRFLNRLRAEEPGDYERAFPFKTVPDDHQLKLFTHARHMTNIALAPVALGTGKTKMALDIAADKYLRDEIDGMVVIAPNGVHLQWVNVAIPEHLSDSVPRVAAAWNGRKVPDNVMRAAGGRRYLRVFAINVDAFSRAQSEGVKATRKLLQSGRFMFIIDESTRVKNAKAERTKTILRLREWAAVRMILTGTPVTKGLEDFFTQYQFLDPNIIGLTNFYAFRNRYCITMPAYRGAGLGAVKITGYRNQEELVRKIAPVSFMIPSSVLGLTEPVYEKREVALTPEQDSIYKMLRDELIEDLRARRITTPANAAVRILRLQQVLSGRYYERVQREGEEDSYVETPRVLPNNRLTALEDLLAEHDGQAIIWARFKEDIDDIVGQISGLGRVAVYDGRTSLAERGDAIERFKSGDLDYIVANQAAGGTGVDGLQAARLAVYYSNSFNYEHRAQSEGRIYRRGQLGQAMFVDMVSPNTVDTLILRNLQGKRDIGRMVMDDPAMLNGGQLVEG
jgi:superfamily II DNA or RNA helicase